MVKTKKKKVRFGRTLFSVAFLAYSLFGSFKNKINLLTHEARVAARSFVKAIVLCTILGALAVTTWIGILALLLLYLLSIKTNPYLSVFIIILINLAILLVISVALSKLIKKVSFQKIREEVFHLE